jgi:putative methionine-R-sulfoxide reductase with GAF domain
MGRQAKKARMDAARLLPELIERLVTISNADELLHEVCRLADEAVGADEVSLLLLDEAGEALVEHEVVGRKLRPTRERLELKGKGLSVSAATARKTVVVPDVRKDKRYRAVDKDTRSEAAVPILSGERLLGVLNFESSRLGYFRATDLPLLSFLGAQLAIALRVAELDREAGLWRDRTAALHNIGRLLGGVAPREVVLQRVADAVRATCGGHYAAVFGGDYERSELVLLAQSSAHPLNIATGARLKFGTGLIGKAFELGETVNVKDVRKDPMYLFRVPGVLSEACVPIRVGDACVGILDAQAQDVAEFTADELMFLETAARMIAPLFRTGSRETTRRPASPLPQEG